MALPHRDSKGIALSIVFVLVLYWQAVSGAGFFFQRDVWLYWTPHIEWAARVLADGKLPQWNPFIGFGAPFLADPNFQFFYPPSVLNWILPPRVAYSVLVVGHAILGSVGAYRLLRPRVRCTSGALVGAAVFVAGGPLVSSANLWHHYSSAMIMPWVVDAFLRLRAGRGSIRRLAFFAALEALAGSADVCVMTGAGLLMLLPRRGRRLRALLPKLGAALSLCMLLAAVQWLPALMVARNAQRANLDPQVRLHWSVSPRSLVDLVLPLTGVFHAVAGAGEYREERLRLIPWMYLGASTLPLLILGARRAPRGAWLLLLAVLVSLGRHTPLASGLGHLPILNTFRFPAKVLWVVSACWAVLAAIGLRELNRRPSRRYWPGIAVGGALAAIGLLACGFSPASATDHSDWMEIARSLPWAPLMLGSMLLAASLGGRPRAAVGLIVILDLVGLGQTYNSYSSGEMFRMRPGIVDELRRLDARRVYVMQTSRSESRSWKTPRHWSDEEAFYFGQSQFLLPPQGMRWSIRGSYDSDFSGLARHDFSVLCSMAIGAEGMVPSVLRLGGVTHAIRFPGARPPEFEVAATIPTFHDLRPLVLRVPDPLPPAYVVHKVRTEASSTEAARALTDPRFDLATEIVRVHPGGAPPPTGRPGSSEARIEFEAEGVEVVRARLSAPGTLVVLNAFSEGWSARVDGQPKKVAPANLIFQSVDLDAGEHRVELEYQTPGLLAGFSLSALAWAWMAFMLTGPRHPKKT